MTASELSVATDLIAVLVAVTEGEPLVLTIEAGQALPSGAFESTHRSLQSGLRAWVERQTQHPLGYVEQLYTFADRDRTPGARVISISYLGLTRQVREADEARWHGWYRYFPWEDHRDGAPPLLERQVAPHLSAWARAAPGAVERRARTQRVGINFGLDGSAWNEELVLQRYELLYEAGLVSEATRRLRPPRDAPLAGETMLHDHRRILATGIARLRAKIKYRPVVFELMPPSFTLLQLQQCVEALAGKRVHKQNFRRVVEQQQLVEETGQIATETGGRPAKLFRFRGLVQQERAFAGTKLAVTRAS